jgi:membrane protein DedA with SNARE-associated domain
MENITTLLMKHGCALLLLCIVGRQACLPIPANLFVLASGALGGAGRFKSLDLLAVIVPTFVAMDLVWYEVGRRYGKRALDLIGRTSSGTGSSVDRHLAAFSRYGIKSLLVSKFILGFDTFAAPAAGLLRVDLSEFILFDGLGATIWTSAYLELGHMFRDQLSRIATYSARFAAIGVALLCGLVVRRVWRHYRFLRSNHQLSMDADMLGHAGNAGVISTQLDLTGSTEKQS